MLSGATALSWAVVVLLASLTALTTAFHFGLPELGGLAFGLNLLAFAAGGLLFGRALDAWGRRNALIVAFLTGAGGALVIYLGVGWTSLPVAVAGLLLTGLGTGGANLTRVAGADMQPPQRRARGIALVLIGAAFGAIGAPIVFAPALAGARAHEGAALAAPWLIAAVLMALGALVLVAIRVDPRRIAEMVAAEAGAGAASAPPARPLGQLLRLPLVPLAILAAIVAQAVMTSMMALAGVVMAGHGHDLGVISLTVSLHFVGMFGLVLIVGNFVQRIGKLRSVVFGLVVLAGGVLLLLPGPELVTFMPGMFVVGVGWNIAFVASSTVLADSAQANERGSLLGFSDFVAILAAAALSGIAGVVVGNLGLAAFVVIGLLAALIPAGLIVLYRRRLEGLPAVQG